MIGICSYVAPNRDQEEQEARRARERQEERECSCGPCQRRSHQCSDPIGPVSEKFPYYTLVTPEEAVILKATCSPSTTFEDVDWGGEEMVQVTMTRRYL